MYFKKRYKIIFISLFVNLIIFTWLFESPSGVGDNWAHWRLGQQYLKQKNYQRAAEGFRYYLVNSDLHARMAGIAHFGLGLLYEDMGEMQRAIDEYNLAIKNDVHPEVSVGEKSYMNIGAIFMRRKDYDDAIHAYLKALERDETNGLAHYYLGMAYLKAGRYDLAEKEALEAQKLGVPLTALSEKLKKTNKHESKSDSEK